MGKLIKCKSCGAEIAKGVKSCPQCGAKNKKPFYKRWWFWAIIVVLLLGSCSSGNDGTTEETVPSAESFEMQTTSDPSESTGVTSEPTEPSVEETEATEESTSVEETGETVDANSATIDSAMVLIESVLKDSYNNYDISYDDGIITINVWEEGVTTAAMLAASGNEDYVDSWNQLVDVQKELCSSILDFIETAGVSDTAVVVNILNDSNTENVLLSIFNGVVLYDCVTE